MEYKFTQEEFNTHYREFIMNPSKYQSMDLNFKEVMFMMGCGDSEFQERINQTQKKKNYTSKTNQEPWIDNEDGDEIESSSDFSYGRDYGDENDADEEY